MNEQRHKKELGMGYGEAYIGHCGGYGADVRMLDDHGNRPHNECKRFEWGKPGVPQRTIRRMR
jgi:hypothetical protein